MQQVLQTRNIASMDVKDGISANDVPGSAQPVKPTHMVDMKGGGSDTSYNSTSMPCINGINQQAKESEVQRFVESLITERVTSLHQDIEEMGKSMQAQSEELEELTFENHDLWTRIKLLEGRQARSDKVIEDLREELLQTQSRQMKDNLMFYNIPEVPGETRTETKDILIAFLKEEMKIGNDEMKRIQMDKVQRNGQPRTAGRPRSITARFIPHDGKFIVLEHIKNLSKWKGYGVSEQLPRELSERKKKLIPKYKEAKAAKRKTQWVNDKLIIDKKVTEVRKDRPMDINVNVEEVASQLRKTTCPPKSYDGSTFQGHKVALTGHDDIVPALHCIYADSRVGRADHNIYAYRITGQNGQIREHFEDDGEWGSGRILLKELQSRQSVNTLLCVTRWCGSRLLGPARFKYIGEAASQVLAERRFTTGEEDTTHR